MGIFDSFKQTADAFNAALNGDEVDAAPKAPKPAAKSAVLPKVDLTGAGQTSTSTAKVRVSPTLGNAGEASSAVRVKPVSAVKPAVSAVVENIDTLDQFAEKLIADVVKLDIDFEVVEQKRSDEAIFVQFTVFGLRRPYGLSLVRGDASGIFFATLVSPLLTGVTPDLLPQCKELCLSLISNASQGHYEVADGVLSYCNTIAYNQIMCGANLGYIIFNLWTGLQCESSNIKEVLGIDM